MTQTLTETSTWTLGFDLRPGDIATHYAPETGDATTFEVLALLPTGSNALILMDTSAGNIQCLAGTIFEVFQGFGDLNE